MLLAGVGGGAKQVDAETRMAEENLGDTGWTMEN